MKSYILAIFGFLISWPILLTLSETTIDQQTYEIIDDITEESESDSSSIEDDDLSYDWSDEDEENGTGPNHLLL